MSPHTHQDPPPGPNAWPSITPSPIPASEGPTADGPTPACICRGLKVLGPDPGSVQSGPTPGSRSSYLEPTGWGRTAWSGSGNPVVSTHELWCSLCFSPLELGVSTCHTGSSALPRCLPLGSFGAFTFSSLKWRHRRWAEDTETAMQKSGEREVGWKGQGKVWGPVSLSPGLRLKQKSR